MTTKINNSVKIITYLSLQGSVLEVQRKLAVMVRTRAVKSGEVGIELEAAHDLSSGQTETVFKVVSRDMKKMSYVIQKGIDTK